MTLAQWFAYGWPWWLQALALAGVAVPALVLAVRLLGWQAALRLAVPLAALLAAFAGLARARQRGWSDHAEKEKRDAQVALESARLARAGAEHADPGRLRDDDGFRRP